jgi:hypothetical protein
MLGLVYMDKSKLFPLIILLFLLAAYVVYIKNDAVKNSLKNGRNNYSSLVEKQAINNSIKFNPDDSLSKKSADLASYSEKFSKKFANSELTDQTKAEISEYAKISTKYLNDLEVTLTKNEFKEKPLAKEAIDQSRKYITKYLNLSDQNSLDLAKGTVQDMTAIYQTMAKNFAEIGL